MRDFLIKLRASKQAMLDKCKGPLLDNVNVVQQRVLMDLIPCEIAILDHVIAEDMGAHPSDLFTEAMERIRLHFDKESPTPYKSWRGATPKDQPSLPKDIRVVFEQLMLEGIWQGEAPHLDPRWDPSS